ncbi:MAG: 3-hydroxyisobutyrate dehydrogenase-like beta-hydroxyacid dehydrogenase [Verrucomicrobiales bacterium]|jgi:3-hydroxyisobutyrate dehydrogenase-like beta-hydroxyacid dehydrogenase
MSEPGTVALLGVGRMGAAMVRALRRAGFDVIVWNRTSSKADAIAAETGASVADTPADAAARAPVVLSVLADDSAVIEVLSAASAGLNAGTVVVEMSTIDPSTLFAVLPKIESAGAVLLDAPVSGSVPQVEQGALTIMVGGSVEGLDRVRPVLDVLATHVFHLGELGSGATMKLAVNSMIHSINVALSEALVLAEKSGVDRLRAYEVIASSAAAAPFVHYKRSAFENPEQGEVAFNLDLVAKDLDLILGLADRVGAPIAQGVVNREVVGRAIAAGLGDDDLSAIAQHLRRTSSD